ncbi:MAG TPA: helicase-associated domain-containing protein, partial [Spirochaetia bacterium]
THGRQPRLLDLMEEEWTTGETARDEITPWIAQSFSSVPETSFIRFADFAEYQAAIGSPLAASASLGGVATGGRMGESPAPGHPAMHGGDDLNAPLGHSSGLATEEALEELWKSFLGIFLGRCLLSLGGAEAAVTAEGRPAFRMTDTGRLLLGLPRDGLPDPEETPAELIVQPNYEVVFLSPSPGAEAELGRFCERVGREVGVLFRITRQSIERATRAGMTADSVIATLSQGSKSPLPVNVAQEIRGWMGFQ